MVLLVDMERRPGATDEEVRERRREFAKALTEISGEECEVLNYTKVDPEVVRKLSPSAIVLSGQGTPWFEYPQGELEGIRRVVLEPPCKLLGICGGHQFLAMCFGAPICTMRLARPGEPTASNPNWRWFPCYKGWFKEEGFLEVKILRPEDPLFLGLPGRIVVHQSHFWEVKRLPKGFLLLATNKNCRIQAMRHKERPIYGVQFHPERFDEEHPHGRRILENFFSLPPSEGRPERG